MRNLVLAALAAIVTAGCMSAGEHRAAVQSDADRLTVGKVQREIRVGMSGAEVAQVLGSPNIVTTDDERREVWVYDRVSTETVYSESRGGVACTCAFISSTRLMPANGGLPETRWYAIPASA